MDETNEIVDPRIRAIAERGRALLEDPEYRRRAAELRAATEAAAMYEHQRARRAALLRAGVPEAAWPFLDTIEERPAVVEARAFLAAGDEKRFITFSGPGGPGKTVTLAWMVAREGGRYVTAPELVHAGSFDRLWDDLEAARFLAIDELGAEHPNPAFASSLYELLDARFRRCRKTGLGTNQNADDFKARYCSGGLERLYRRMKETGIWVNLWPTSAAPEVLP